MKIKKIVSVSLPVMLTAICLLIFFQSNSTMAASQKDNSDIGKKSDWKAPDQ